MNAMIGELLDFARGGAAPERVDVDLDKVVPTSLEDLAARGDGRCRSRSSRCRSCAATRRSCASVLQNLVANAVKFSGRGMPSGSGAERAGPTAGGSASPTAARASPSEDRERAFEPMVRLDQSEPGTGIGLATCRRIVAGARRPDGLDDNPGGGAVVWFELPAS